MQAKTNTVDEVLDAIFASELPPATRRASALSVLRFGAADVADELSITRQAVSKVLQGDSRSAAVEAKIAEWIGRDLAVVFPEFAEQPPAETGHLKTAADALLSGGARGAARFHNPTDVSP